MGTASAEPNPETNSDNAPALTPPPPKAGPFFGRADWQSFGLTVFLIFIVYLFTLAPSIDLSWGGILSTGAMYGGVPHPPGFPLWTMYAHLFAVLIPFGEMAWRISVSSAFASALACGLIALVASRCGLLIVENLRGFQRLPPNSEKWLRIVSGCVAGMSFGLSGSVWARSVVNDWWPLNFALFATLLCLLIRWSYAPEKNRYLYAAVLVYACTLMNERVSCFTTAAPGLIFFILFIAPALARDIFAACAAALLYVLIVTRDSAAPSLWRIYLVLAILAVLLTVAITIKTRRLFTKWNIVLGCLACVALGLGFSFYSAIASMTNPPMNWGYPRTVEGFFHTIEHGQYENLHSTDDWNRYRLQFRLYWSYVCHDYGRIYLLPAAVPFMMLHRMRPHERRWMFGLLSFFLCMSFFLLAILNPGDDRASSDMHAVYFTLSYLSVAIWTGCGLVLLGSVLARPYERRIGDLIPPEEVPADGEAKDNAREDAWKEVKEISKKN
jgi:hypothetical protein